MADGRWPPVYDPEDVKRAIATLASGAAADSTRFYGTIDPASGDLCQGDVVQFHSGLPAIDEQGEISVAEEVDFWFVLGNSCDYNRSLDEVPSFLASPLYELPEATPVEFLGDLRWYRLSRSFFLPRWPGAPGSLGFVADLTKIAMFSRRLLATESAQPMVVKKRWHFGNEPRPRSRAVVVARLSQDAWLLLNAALVRFLARDDGRYDAANG